MEASVYRHDMTSGRADAGMERNRDMQVPSGYNDNRIVLMVRDPWTLYTYWEVKKEVEDRVRDDIRRKDLAVSKSVLRVYDVTESGPDREPSIIFDFELKNWANSWYVHAGKPGRKWMVDIGILCAT
ncbi:MAG: DUF4912 domain-containing protein, partial [Candidatus Omnitrophica bacterium]|nr:DUF4912 domain-containing protein [Candidatus Omnitrophota bacterium]